MVSYVKPRAEHVTMLQTRVRVQTSFRAEQGHHMYRPVLCQMVLPQRYHINKSSFATLSSDCLVKRNVAHQRADFPDSSLSVPDSGPHASLPNNFRVPFAIWPTTCCFSVQWLRHDPETGYSTPSEPFIFVYDIIPRVQNPTPPFHIQPLSQWL
jgi:hypothetical protein